MPLRLTDREFAKLNQSAIRPSRDRVPQKKQRNPKHPRAARRAPIADGPEIAITVLIAPQPKQRARTAPNHKVLFQAFNGAHGNLENFQEKIRGRLMHSITPESTRAFEAAIRAAASAFMLERRLQPLDCPVEMEIRLCLKGDRETWPTAPRDGDIDNLAKAVKDAVNRIVYTDDRLIVRSTQLKECGDEASVFFLVRPARL